MRPPPKLTVHEWAEAKRVVSIGTTPEPGRWRSKPYQRPVLEEISNPRHDGVVYIAASQGGAKTEVLLNTAGFHMEADPAPILLTTYSIEMAEGLSKDRLASMIRDTPCLRDLVADSRSRDSGNTIRHKIFPGGYVTLVGANSPGGLAMRPIRVLLFDEIDRYPPSAGTEGDPVSLAEVRASAFWNARKVYVTSPGDKKLDRSWRLWEKTDKREYHVPCPDCGHEQILRWAQVHFDRDDHGKLIKDSVVYVCEQCGSAWDDVTRWRAIGKGTYKATAEYRGFAGFRLPGMAVLGRPLWKAAEKWLEVQGNPEELRVFINTYLTEWHEGEEGDGIDDHEIRVRAISEDFEKDIPSGADMPAGAAVLTLGFDAQTDHLKYQVIGWGRGEESWSLAAGRIYGDVKQDPTILQQLDQVLAKAWRHPYGLDLYIRAACIDTGYATQTLYKWCKPRFMRPLPDGRRQFVFAIKGRSEPGRPVWPDVASKKGVLRTRLWVLGVDAAKDQIFSRLRIVEPGPGCAHFRKSYPIEFFEQLTSEKAKVRWVRGRPYRGWELKQKGRPNDWLDTYVYGYAGLCGLQADGFGLDLEREVAFVQAHAGRAPVLVGPASTPDLPGPLGGGGRRRRVRSRGFEA